jgi:hypothetical protein
MVKPAPEEVEEQVIRLVSALLASSVRARDTGLVRAVRTLSSRPVATRRADRSVEQLTPHAHLLRLQRSAGNRAVTALMSGAHAAPTLAAVAQRQAAAPPPSCRPAPALAPPTTVPPFAHVVDPSWMTVERAPTGLASIRSSPGSGPGELGFTPHRDAEPPGITFTPYEVAPGSWTTRIALTPAPTLRVPATFPGPGVHHVDAEHFVISPRISDAIRRAELEHVEDHVYAQQLVSQTISRIVFRAMAAPRPQASSADEAVRCGWEWLRAALPDRLRWPAGHDLGALSFLWLQRQNGLANATLQRDGNGWHSLARTPLSGAGKRRLGLPADEAAFEVTDGRNEIGRHDTEPLLQQRWSAMGSF